MIKSSDIKKGKCKTCGKEDLLFLNSCPECHSKTLAQAKREGIEDNYFVGGV
jgi:uncharacterized OB-fold protein